MGDSGDIDTLDRQVSLLRDMMEKLDRRREERRAATGVTRSSPDPTSSGEPGSGTPRRRTSGPLRLVGDGPGSRELGSPELGERAERPPGGTGPPASPKDLHRPHFREKRPWDLSRSSAPAASEAGPSLSSAAPLAVGSQEKADDVVPARLFEGLRRERDDLALQVMRLQAAEQKLLEERASQEGKDVEIGRLRQELLQEQQTRFGVLLERLYRRLVEAEELENLLIQRAVRAVPGSSHEGSAPARPQADKMPPSQVETGKKLWMRGHEIVVATSPKGEETFYSFAVLTTDLGRGNGMKGFHSTADSAKSAELECIRLVLEFLERSSADIEIPRLESSRNLATIRGRKVDIFCDLVGEGKFQAFPFLYDEKGRRRIIMQFHLDEAVTGDTPEEARLRCVHRLEAHFDNEGPVTAALT